MENLFEDTAFNFAHPFIVISTIEITQLTFMCSPFSLLLKFKKFKSAILVTYPSEK